MEICRHNAKLKYVRMMDVSTYLNKLLANDALNDDLLRNFQAVERVLSHPACEIVRQLQFDLDLIEASNGFCFSISKREFVPNAIPSHLGRSLSATVRHHLNLDTLKKTSGLRRACKLSQQVLSVPFCIQNAAEDEKTSCRWAS